MKKLIIIPVILFTLTWIGCQQIDEFNYMPAEVNSEKIDSIFFSPNHHMLIADGNAALNFYLESYYKYTYTIDGVEVDSTSILNQEDLPEGLIQIFHVESGQEVTGNSWTTTDHSAGTASFYAKSGNITTEPVEVTLIEKPEIPEKRYVDVVFHVLELSHSDPTYNKFFHTEITNERLAMAVEDLNAVFNNELGHSPCGASANIEFRLAENDQYGYKLEKPGQNVFMYEMDDISVVYSWGYSYISINAMIEKIFDAQSYMFFWDPEKYLNIHVLPLSLNADMQSKYPTYQIVPGGTPMDGMGMAVSDESLIPEPLGNYKNLGLPVSRNVLNLEEGTRLTIANNVCRFWGLSPSQYGNDYCNDTRSWSGFGSDGTNEFYTLYRTSPEGYKFKCDNATDFNLFPSLRNTITLDQVKRIRYAIENCPGRSCGIPAN